MQKAVFNAFILLGRAEPGGLTCLAADLAAEGGHQILSGLNAKIAIKSVEYHLILVYARYLLIGIPGINLRQLLQPLITLTISGLSLILVSNEIGYKVKWLG